MRLILGLFLISFSLLAAVPYNVEEEARFSALEIKQYKRDVWDITSTLASGDTVTFSTLPEHAVVTQNYFLVEDAVVSASDNTIALGCDTSSDLLTARDFTNDSANDLITGTASGSTAQMVHISTSGGCTITATVGSGVSGITDGKVIIFTEFVKGE